MHGCAACHGECVAIHCFRQVLATATREWSTRELLRAVAATENAGRLDAALLARAAFSLAPATAMRGRVEGKDEV